MPESGGGCTRNVPWSYSKARQVFPTLCGKILGHVIENSGVHPCTQKGNAVKGTPAPTNQMKLKAYFGMLTFYSKFIPNMPVKLNPLYNLLKTNQSWHWSYKGERCFQESKQWLGSDNILTIYNPSKPLGLVADAPTYGVEVVLFHVVNGHKHMCAP